jgi:hypothetical protein
MVAKVNVAENSDSQLSRKLSEYNFKFSGRMLSMFAALELATVGDVAAIPLERYTCFRGFKSQCICELIYFIETERLQSQFEGFEKWKRSMTLL